MKQGSCQGDLSIDQANKLDMALQEPSSVAEFGGANSDQKDRSLIEDSCDKKLRNIDFYADGAGALMRSSRQSSLLAEFNREDVAALSSIKG